MISVSLPPSGWERGGGHLVTVIISTPIGRFAPWVACSQAKVSALSMTILIIMMLVFLTATPAKAATFTPTPVCPTTAGSCGSDVSYPLRHSFSMAPGIGGAEKNESTSCFDVPGTDQYECRLVAGVEEVGDNRNFHILKDDGLGDGDDGTFGHQVVARDGIVYEGCALQGNGDWLCDYAGRHQVSMKHYQSDGYVWRVFWSWQKYTKGQAGCALALNGLWSTGGWRAWTAAIGDCMNGPMERP